MNLQRVFEILEERAALMDYTDSLKCSGCNVEELIVNEWTLKYHPDAGFTEDDFDTITLFEQEGGEDQGSYYAMIFKVKDKTNNEECFVRYVGHYDSWNGTDWYNEPEIVTPTKRMVEVTDWNVVR